MPHDLRDRVLALAGIFQAATLVRDTARKGRDLGPMLEASIHSLFMTDAESVEQVYGGAARLRLGLEVLRHQLDGNRRGGRDGELTRYVVALLFLERKLSRQPAMLQQMADGIDAARGQAEYFASEIHASVVARLADLYVKTISNLTPRVMVSGEPGLLHSNADLIRALLLAGIRSAVLWRQCGGSRLQLLLRRRRLVQLATHLSREAQPQTS